MDQLEGISIGAAQKNLGVVVWPEVPAPFSLQDANFLARAQRIARGAGARLFGWRDRWKPLGNGRLGVNNSAALLGPNASLDFIYDKIHLVPFSEYVPWRNWFFFARELTGLIGDFQPGTHTKWGTFPAGRSAFTSATKRFSRMKFAGSLWRGRNSLLTFRTTAGSAARAPRSSTWRWRACERWKIAAGFCATRTTESRFPSIRTGASWRGCRRIFAGNWTSPYAFRSDLTLFARWGDWLPWLCVLVALVLVLIAVRRTRARKNSCYLKKRGYPDMMFEDLQRQQEELESASTLCGVIFDVAQHREPVNIPRKKIAQPDFWKDPGAGPENHAAAQSGREAVYPRTTSSPAWRATSTLISIWPRKRPIPRSAKRS